MFQGFSRLQQSEKHSLELKQSTPYIWQILSYLLTFVLVLKKRDKKNSVEISNTFPVISSPLLQGLNPCSANALNVSLSSLKSILVPTRIMGASGQWCFSSGYHLDVTFSNEEGLKDARKKAEQETEALKTENHFLLLSSERSKFIHALWAMPKVSITLQHWNKWGKRLFVDSWEAWVGRSLLARRYLIEMCMVAKLMNYSNHRSLCLLWVMKNMNVCSVPHKPTETWTPSTTIGAE